MEKFFVYLLCLLPIFVCAGNDTETEVTLDKRKIKTPFGVVSVESPNFSSCERLPITDYGALQGNQQLLQKPLQLLLKKPISLGAVL
ncbi:hypothetical protein M1D52_04190 [Olivibacter sp. SA151]|uniref:hypothetical protein n=1 Tax=Olivibacter jilunii TaxID=985016 RepID=UPI003F1556C7